jgi:hypothetical protein
VLLHCTDGSTVPVLEVNRINLFSTAYCFNIEVKYCGERHYMYIVRSLFVVIPVICC